MALPFFATVPRGMESLLAGELRSLGAEHVKQARAGVSFQGTLETAYRVCLWSRLAGRVLLPLATGPAADGDELEVDIDSGKVRNRSKGLAIDMKPVPSVMRKLLEDGGVVEHFKKNGGFKFE